MSLDRVRKSFGLLLMSRGIRRRLTMLVVSSNQGEQGISAHQDSYRQNRGDAKSRENPNVEETMRLIVSGMEILLETRFCNECSVALVTYEDERRQWSLNTKIRFGRAFISRDQLNSGLDQNSFVVHWPYISIHILLTSLIINNGDYRWRSRRLRRQKVRL